MCTKIQKNPLTLPIKLEACVWSGFTLMVYLPVLNLRPPGLRSEYDAMDSSNSLQNPKWFQSQKKV